MARESPCASAMADAAVGVGEGSLWERWQALKAAAPALRAREAALELGVSEAELIDGSPHAQRLAGDWGALIEALPAVGPVMALTRNDTVVIEKTGPVEAVEIYRGHGMGQVVGSQIDLRLFLRHWVHGLAVSEPVRSGSRDSLQFFDAQGVAVHKVYRVKDTDATVWSHLVERCRDPDPAVLRVESSAPSAASVADDAIDREALRDAWQGMANTHEFHGLLRRFGLERRQALRLAGADLAQPVARDSYRPLLERARDQCLAMMLFVGNHGCIQIHTGPVCRLETVGHWLNILDPGFNLHLMEPAVREAWIVRKPTEQGVVTSLECFDGRGELVLQCFGARKGGAAESLAWRELIGGLLPAEG